MTGPDDLFKYQALLLPWRVTGVRTLARYGLQGSSWHDGDTFNALIDMGVRGHFLYHVRTAGYDSPEIDELATRKPAEAARGYASGLVDTGEIVYLDSLDWAAAHNTDSFGRMLAVVTLPDGRDLAQLMIGAGHGVPMTRHRL